MKSKFLGLLVLFLPTYFAVAQHDHEIVEGKVYELHEGHNHGFMPLFGANVYWLNTTDGTVTDTNGYFKLESNHDAHFIVVSYTGYQSDTIHVHDHEFIEVTLKDELQLESVEVVKRRKTSAHSLHHHINTIHITEGELHKAACCNLSESFETNPSVDVSFTDAITGTKQIQMLGLAGPYTQITRENIPDVRGLSAIYGMEYVPGAWIESIQLNKGTGSVVNGFESIAGQINVEFHKPENTERLYLNVYGNEDSRIEANLSLAHKLNQHVSTGLLVHARTNPMEMDRNSDGFMDKPTGDQLILLNRWKFQTENHWESQLGVKATFNDLNGGQMSGLNTTGPLWQMQMQTKRLDAWAKLGKVFENDHTKSFGSQYAFSVHDQNSVFGLRSYNALQKSFYGNFIYQSLMNEHNDYKLGFSYQHDNYSETLFDTLEFSRNEVIPGVFAEYTYKPGNNFGIVAGVRADYHNTFGMFITPRLHVRYALAENSVLRFSAGRGQRSASIFAENSSFLASARNVVLPESNNSALYGLDPEVAWNFGFNLTQKFSVDHRDGSFAVDVYHTLFENQVVRDLDYSPQAIWFYNLDGKSYATSVQAQLDYELVRRLDMRIAYRWYNVKTQYTTGLMQKPFISPHRAFINLAYATKKHWKFDYTVQWQGEQRIPSTETNPEEYQLDDYSPSFFLMNAQISKQWWERFDVYVGAENLLDFTQEDPILASEDPFGDYFDSSLVWGPIFGRMFYAGIRLKIK